MISAHVPFEKSVFINCPFDVEYPPLLRPLLFTVLIFGLSPRLALEKSDSGEPRLKKILSLIRASRFGIHDLSRCCANRKGELFRLNMPLELGLDLGCRHFRGGRSNRKSCLILEKERYRFQKAVSDLSGLDICAHGNNPQEVVRVTRDWLIQEAAVKPLSASKIWAEFCEFMADNYNRLTAEGYTPSDIELLPVVELRDHMADWVVSH